MTNLGRHPCCRHQGCQHIGQWDTGRRVRAFRDDAYGHRRFTYGFRPKNVTHVSRHRSLWAPINENLFHHVTVDKSGPHSAHSCARSCPIRTTAVTLRSVSGPSCTDMSGWSGVSVLQNECQSGHSG
eukprot:Selendium_serpulae@DN6313_c0_g1_i3.p1